MVLLAVDDTIRRFIEYRGSLFGLHAPVVSSRICTKGYHVSTGTRVLYFMPQGLVSVLSNGVAMT